MSRASEYAAAFGEACTRKPDSLVAANPLAPVARGNSTEVAWVNTDGTLALARAELSQVDALKLADWLMDTFGPRR